MNCRETDVNTIRHVDNTSICYVDKYTKINVDILRIKKSLLLSLKERYLSAGSLYEFFKAAWPYIEGNMPYVDSWHIRC